jgi:hypothetical protein
VLYQVSAFAADPLALGSKRELFVDGHVLDTMDGTRLKLHHPQPANATVHFEKPWEGLYSGYVTVLKDGDTYRMYYRGLPQSGKDGSELETTCTAVSKDGINWTKPNVGVHEIDGSTNNNAILYRSAPYSHNFSPFVDTRTDVPADERYKGLGGTRSSGLVAYVSSDGLRWRKLQEEAVIQQGALDSQNVPFWSEAEQQYVCYLRTFTKGEFAGFRTISRTTSKDFINWTPIEEMSYGDTQQEHLYTNQTHPYFRAPHIYVAVAARFMPGRRVVSEEAFTAIGGEAKYSGDCSDAVFMTTRGGTVYDRTFMEGFMRPGHGLNNWTSRTNYPALGVVPTGPAEMSLYVQRNYGQPTGFVQRMVLRTDGFVSLNAPYGGGDAVSKLLTFEGKQLTLNFATSAAGSVWVELIDMAGVPIDGFRHANADELVGDDVDRVVTWSGNADVSALAGKPVRMRFIMKDADIYSFRFGS